MRVRRARTRARVGASERDERAQRESERDGQREEAEGLTGSVGSRKMGAVRFGEADGDGMAERKAVRWGRAKQAGEEAPVAGAVQAATHMRAQYDLDRGWRVEETVWGGDEEAPAETGGAGR